MNEITRRLFRLETELFIMHFLKKVVVRDSEVRVKRWVGGAQRNFREGKQLFGDFNGG